MDPRCKICIFMGKTDPEAPKHKQQVLILSYCLIANRNVACHKKNETFIFINLSVNYSLRWLSDLCLHAGFSKQNVSIGLTELKLVTIGLF